MERTKLERLLLGLSLLIPFILAFQVLSKEIYFLTLGLTLLAFFLEGKGVFLPRFFINASGVLFIIFFLLTVNLSNFLENALRTLFLLLTLKLLERKRLRDFFQIYLLEFLIFAGFSYFFTSFWFFLLLFVQIVLISYALFLHLYMEEGEAKFLRGEELRHIILTLGLLLSFTFLLSSLFFLGLPRLSSPLFNLFTKEEKKAQSGFTDKIRLGEISEIQESSRVILRFILESGNLTHPESLYFRVMTYDYFDGKTWQKGMTIPDISPFKGVPMRGKRATIYLEEDLEGYLPVPEYTSQVRSNVRIRGLFDGTYALAEVTSYPLKYEVSFVEGHPMDEEINLEAYLQVPEVKESIRELAQRLRGKTQEETLRNILAYYQRENFKYSLKDLPLGAAPLERFLFETKRGNCEYFAGATALLLRMNEVPARLVGGFKGAIYQKRGNYYLVLERFAHAWVEAYIGGKWIRVDPSPTSTFQAFPREGGLLSKLRLYADIINFYYTKFILDYDLKKQKKLLHLLGKTFSQVIQKKEYRGQERDGSFSSLRKGLIFILLLVIFVGLFLKYRGLFKFLGRCITHPEVRLYYAFERELKKRGYIREPWEGIFDLVDKIGEPELREGARRFAEIYSSYYYKEKAFDKEALEELKSWLKRLKSLR